MYAFICMFGLEIVEQAVASMVRELQWGYDVSPPTDVAKVITDVVKSLVNQIPRPAALLNTHNETTCPRYEARDPAGHLRLCTRYFEFKVTNLT